MQVLVDTSVWSLALRRRKRAAAETDALEELIRDGRAVLIGAVRQEILSGIRDDKQFRRLSGALDAFVDESVSTGDHVAAARLCNACIRSGVTAANTDCLICAVAIARRMEVLTTDKDFTFISRIVPIRLYKLP